ncbi:LCP family protein [Aeromicrobium sp. 179-A 4D2 NHS]|uniref:LCP family protein n=1 Tax=Aeromicrobium sp. 179-A 4D2 NHS TaxID=3142375 RepID=UPI0039A2132A
MHHDRTSALGGTYADPAGATARIRFRRALTLAAMTLVMPGSAQLVQGNKRVGRIAIRIWLSVLAVVAVLGLLALMDRQLIFGLATNAALLTLGRWLLIGLALGWVVLIVDAWRLGRPRELHGAHLAISTAFHGALVVGTAAILFFAAHTVSVMNGFTDAVFASTTVSEPHDGRYNVLLMGTDSGKDRSGMRPDSINVASIDAETGKAVLIGLPRNLENVPFPKGSVMRQQFPNGFDCDGCYLNAVNTWANDHADLFDSKEPGIDATMDAIEEITGLKLNYYALVNMKGFSKLIDAVGGVRINVRERTAIGGIGSPIRGYIEAGERKLSGDHALWYARSRVENDDWSRMGRQKCVMNAMVRQLNPQKVIMNMQDIADSSSAMLHTNIPRQDLNVFMDLALKTKSQPISSVSLVPPVIYTGNPDFDKVRRLVSDAVQTSEGDSEIQKSRFATAKLPVVETGDEASKKDPRKANRSADLNESC